MKSLMPILAVVFLISCNQDQDQGSYEEGYEDGYDRGHNAICYSRSYPSVEHKLGKPEYKRGFEEGKSSGVSACKLWIRRNGAWKG